MNKLLLGQRVKEFNRIIDSNVRKDERGIFVIPASLARLFVAIIQENPDDDALRTWGAYLLEAKA